MVGGTQPPHMITTDTTYAIACIRARLGLRRLDPRRLYLVDDGAYLWIGDRADLTAPLARCLRAAHRVGSRPDLATASDRAAADGYDAACSVVRNLASVCGGGLVSWDDLPESWRDGSALGPIRPL